MPTARSSGVVASAFGHALTFAPKTYYGRQNILYSAGCRDGRLAAIGDTFPAGTGLGSFQAYYRLYQDPALDEKPAPELYASYQQAPQPFLALVDYAHTPDALEKVAA